VLVEDRSAPSPAGDEPAVTETPVGPNRGQVVIAAVATGLLGGLAFPPFDVGWLAVLAPAPTLWLWRQLPPARAARAGWLCGVCFYAVALWWLHSLSPVAMPLLGSFLALWWAGAGALVAALHRRGLTAPWWPAAVWVAMESLRGAWPFGGLTWGEWGYAFHDIPVVRALAPFGGVRLITGLVVVVAGVLVDVAVAAARHTIPRTASALAGAVAVAAVVGSGIVGPGTHATRQVRIAAVQGNDLNRDLTPEERQANYLPANHFRLAEGIEGPVDLVIFPESSMDASQANAAAVRDGITATATRFDAAVIANDSSVSLADGRRENVNSYYDATGQLVGTYAKRHLVPFGEYIPFRSLFGDLSVLDRVGRDTRPGDGRVIWDVAGVPFGTMICFESAFAADARGYARDGAELLVVTTNNRSYQRTANTEQHVAMSQMRAAETGRPLVHAAISGMSAFIDADGDVVSRTELFEPTVLVETVTATTGRTPYVVLGEWVVGLAWLGVGLGVAVVLLRARRDRRRTPAPGEIGGSEATGARRPDVASVP
jgi:apolipoprotein N-acyltransferase